MKKFRVWNYLQEMLSDADSPHVAFIPLIYT